jgi:putative hemin transport protein
MENTLTGNSLKSSWLSFREKNPKTRIRNAAAALQTTEAEILAAFTGSSVLRLKDQFAELWKRMPELGYVMSLTRNESCVHERRGVFENIKVNSRHVGYVAGKDIDLRMFFQHWAFGFAVFDDEKAGFKKSIQVFDQQGVAVTKIYLEEKSNHAAFENLVREFADENQSAALHVLPEEPAHVYADGNIDIPGFHKSWGALQDTHDFYPMLLKYNVSRLHALHIGGSFTRRVSNASTRKLLYDFSASGMQIMVFTGNHGNVQIHTGPVKKIVEIPGWINVIDPEFDLHLREGDIAESWVVEKPNSDGGVHSLEMYDAAGNLILSFFGKRKPGIPESTEWREYVTGIPSLEATA